MLRRLTWIGLGLILGCMLAWGWNWIGSGTNPLAADPWLDPNAADESLTPGDVVRRQLAALQSCGEGSPAQRDAAMAVVYSLASPENRRAIGTFGDFDRLVRSGIYGRLVGHQTAMVGRVVMQPTRAIVVVTVIPFQGGPLVFQFVLGRYRAGESEELAWMTDAVYPMGPISAEPLAGT